MNNAITVLYFLPVSFDLNTFSRSHFHHTVHSFFSDIIEGLSAAVICVLLTFNGFIIFFLAVFRLCLSHIAQQTELAAYQLSAFVRTHVISLPSIGLMLSAIISLFVA